MANAANLINFGAGGGTAVGDVVYSTYPLTAPSYLPLNNDTASYLTSSYPALGAIFAPTTVAYSTTTTTLPFNSAAYNFNFGNSTYLGWDTTGNIIISPDCTTWNVSAINTDYFQKGTGTYSGGTAIGAPVYATGGWLSMAYGNGRFVAIRSAPLFYSWQSGSFYYDTYSIGGTAVSSDNGLTWTQGTIAQAWVSGADLANIGVTYNWKCIGFGNGYFQAYGVTRQTTSNNWILVSSFSADGVEWSAPTGNNLGFVGTNLFYLVISTMAYGNGVFVTLIGGPSAAADNTAIYRSGTTPATTSGWSYATMPTTQRWKGIAFGNGVFVAVGSGTGAGSNVACTSTNGTSWTNRTMPATLDWQSVTFANGYFVAVGISFGGASSTNAIATSTDGITWTLRATTTSNNRGPVAGGNGRFVYQDSTGNLAGASTATTISLNTASSSFTLPMVAPMTAMTPYMKAT